MNKAEIEQFVMRYLEATGCQIIEKRPAGVTVKLSPEADKELTNRSYYWNFVERTGAEPETMTYHFIFDPEKRQEEEEQKNKQSASSATAQNGNSILGRYFGFVPTSAKNRTLQESVTYGCRRLEQIFQAVKTRGRYVHLFEEPEQKTPYALVPTAYYSWLGVNYKVEFTCDMKRDEIHSIGISLSTGEIIEHFHQHLLTKKLTPRLPANTHVKETITLQRAAADLQKYIENKVKTYDHTWAEEAQQRLKDELDRIDSFYEDMLLSVEEDKKEEIREQYENRKNEIEWQYKPRIQVSVINCGIFHTLSDRFTFSNKITEKK